jgi:hypothetical protein
LIMIMISVDVTIMIMCVTLRACCFGGVQALDQVTQHKVAIKLVKSRKGCMEQAQHEINVLRVLNHRDPTDVAGVWLACMCVCVWCVFLAHPNVLVWVSMGLLVLVSCFVVVVADCTCDEVLF